MNVSVIIATFGGPEWRELATRRALPSVEAQTIQAHEVRLVHQETLHEARNLGALAASGDWLCFLDADDELEAGYLEQMAAALPCRGFDRACPCQDGDSCHYEDAPGSPAFAPLTPPLLVPSVRYLDRRGQADAAAAIPNAEPRRSLIEVNRAVIGTLISRELFLDVGGFGDEPIYEDWSLWLRCVRAGAELVHVPDAVYRAHVNRRGRNRYTRTLAEQWYWRIRREHEGTHPALVEGAGW